MIFCRAIYFKLCCQQTQELIFSHKPEITLFETGSLQNATVMVCYTGSSLSWCATRSSETSGYFVPSPWTSGYLTPSQSCLCNATSFEDATSFFTFSSFCRQLLKMYSIATICPGVRMGEICLNYYFTCAYAVTSGYTTCVQVSWSHAAVPSLLCQLFGAVISA